MIGKTLRAYQIVAKLGEGGMGEVYRARDPRLDRDVAIKVLGRALAADAAALARFEREAMTIAKLSHPNILAIFEFGREPSAGADEAGTAFLVTDDPARDRAPMFTPDGQSLVFYSNRNGTYETWVVGVDGGGLRKIGSVPGGHRVECARHRDARAHRRRRPPARPRHR
ncbi:MAG TPA: protein kinase [Vicinamibacterales bacterium]|nr:protein kinase [Vicinamibacterales bacterium]